MALSQLRERVGTMLDKADVPLPEATPFFAQVEADALADVLIQRALFTLKTKK